MSQTVSPKQAAALWALLATGGQGRKPPASADPAGLLAQGLIRLGYREGSKAALAEVTDKGWAWADRHCGDADGTPKPLLPWLSQIRAYLDARDLTLADLIVAPPAPLNPTPVKAKKPPTAPQIRKRIRAAYLEITEGRTNEGVRLTALRTALPDLDRGTVDAGLARILKGDKKARLSQISDPKSISAAERAAAFSPGGEPFHLIWIHA